MRLYLTQSSLLKQARRIKTNDFSLAGGRGIRVCASSNTRETSAIARKQLNKIVANNAF